MLDAYEMVNALANSSIHVGGIEQTVEQVLCNVCTVMNYLAFINIVIDMTIES